MKGGKRRYLYLAVFFLCIYLFKTYCLDDKNILGKVAERCSRGGKQLKLNQVTDFDWDTAYIQYGLSTEFMFYDYNLNDAKNVTETYGVSLYFVKEGKVVYMENHENYMRTSPEFTAVVHQPPIYVQFHDSNRRDHQGKRERVSISAIFYNNTDLSISIRDTPNGYHVCTLTGGIGKVSGIYGDQNQPSNLNQ